MSAIKANNVSKSFRNVFALHNISMELADGETIILLGPNGAGKSTLLKILAGLYKQTHGDVEVLGSVLPLHASRIRGNVSFLGENYALYDELTVKANLRFFGRLHDLDEREIGKRTGMLLNKFDAMQYMDRKVGELSRGTKQKVAICRAMINNPKLLLLDEPSAFLDPVASRRLHEMLNDLTKNGVSIVYATQRLDELYKLGNRVLLLNKGKRIAYGNVDSIINRLRDVEVEIIVAEPIGERAFGKLKRKWALGYGDSPRALVFRLSRINQIPSVVKDVVKNDGKIISVLYLKESIDRILSGN